MRVVPVDVARGHFTFAGKQGQEADAVAFLYRIVVLHTGYFENGEQVGDWTTYDSAGRVYKFTKMKR